MKLSWLTLPISKEPALSNKSVNQVPKVFAGYGFIWILSGLLLRNNLNYRGDYFHKT